MEQHVAKKKYTSIRQRLGRGSWRTCAKIRGISPGNGVDTGCLTKYVLEPSCIPVLYACMQSTADKAEIASSEIVSEGRMAVQSDARGVGGVKGAHADATAERNGQ